MDLFEKKKWAKLALPYLFFYLTMGATPVVPAGKKKTNTTKHIKLVPVAPVDSMSPDGPALLACLMQMDTTVILL